MSPRASPLSPLWIDDEGVEEPPPPPPFLNPDCGSKQSIARRVATSPQRYSGAFHSKTPRFGKSAYYSASDPRRLAAQDEPNRFYTHVADQQPHLSVKDPERESLVFRSVVSRFPGAGAEGRGLHPNMRIAQPSFAVDASTQVASDRSHWTRNGFYHPRTPRLPQSPRPLGAEPDASSNYLSDARGHVDAMQLSLVQSVQVSPRNVAVMRSRSRRFTTPLTYVMGESRNVLGLQPPYAPNTLGPGTYEGAAAAKAMAVREPDKEQCTFASGSPRLPKEPAPLNVGSNMSSVAIDRSSWVDSHMWVGKAASGREVPGAQPGSYEGLDGIGRSISPERRSPDVTYTLDQSALKRPLALEVGASRQRYSPAFRSNQERLQPSQAELRASKAPVGAMDTFDLSASAAFSLSQMSLDASKGDSGRGSPAFASESARFAPVRHPEGSGAADSFHADRKHWHSCGQPLTAHSERFAKASGPEGLTSPGPGTYDWSPQAPHQAPWDSPRTTRTAGHAKGSMSARTMTATSPTGRAHHSARRRLDVNGAF